MVDEVAVRIGAETDGLQAGAKEAQTAIGGIEGAAENLQDSIGDLSKAVNSLVAGLNAQAKAAAAVKKPIDDNAKSFDNLLTKIKAETAAWSLERKEREATLKTMAQTDAMTRQGIKLTDEQTAALMAQNRALAAAQQAGGGPGPAKGLFGLKPNEVQNLSFQVNDLVTQIASGASPAQAFAQQGGQIVQIFGPAMAASLVSLLPALAAVAAAFGALALGMMRAGAEAQTIRTLNSVLALNADGARYNAQALAENVKALDAYGASMEEARGEVQLFIQKGLDPSRIVAFGKSAQDLADIMKTDVTAASAQVVTAFTGGYDAVVKLDEAYNFLSETQRNEIREAFQSGDAKRAQAEAFAAFQAKVKESAEYARGPGTEATRTFARAWDELLSTLANTDAIQGARGAILDMVGAVSSAIDRFNKLDAAQRNFFTNSVKYAGPWGVTSLLGDVGSDILDGDQSAKPKGPQASIAGIRDALKPKAAPADPQAKAANDIVAALQRQRNETLKINDAQRITLAGDQAVLKATNEQRIVRKDLLDSIRKEAEETKKAEIAKENAASAKSGMAAARAAQAAKTRAAREALQDEIAAIDQRKQAAEGDYELQMMIEGEKLERLKGFYGEGSREYQAALTERTRMAQAHEALLDQMARARTQAERQVAQIGADAEVAAQRATVEERKAVIQESLAAGQITNIQALQSLAALKAQELKIERDAVEARYQLQLKALQDELALQSLKVDQRAAIENQITVLTAQHEADRKALVAQTTASTNESSRQQVDALRQHWTGILAPIGNGLANLGTSVLAGTATAAQAWQQFGQVILGQVTQWAASMVTKWLVAEAMKTGATAAGVTTRVGIEAAGTAQTTAITGAGALVQIAQKAAVAAAGAYAAIAGIPVIGPVLAPLAAAAALAGVLALGKAVFSAEGGWGEVPADGMQTTLHKKEMVLPASIATPLRAAIATSGPGALSGAGSGTGGDTYQVSIQALDGASLRRVLESNSDLIFDVLKDRIRNGQRL